MDDEATDTSVSAVPNSQPSPPPSNQEATVGQPAHTPMVPDSTKKVEPLQMQLGFERKGDYNDFRVCHLQFELTIDLAAYADA